MQRTRIGVFFGGQSPEHEVSVITGLQVASALDSQLYDVIPVYVSKGGRWFTGKYLSNIGHYSDLEAVLKKVTEVSIAPGPGRTLALLARGKTIFTGNGQHIDVAFLAFHGGAGENGSVQGMCETMNVPFTGSSVLASALGMDKVRSKESCRQAGIPVVDWVEIWESEWRGSEESVLGAIEGQIGYPAIVKPVRLGSSIGIAGVKGREALDEAIEGAFRYDASVLIERCIPNLRELNCSVLGSRDRCQVSVLEEPAAAGALLSFDDKYRRRGSSSKSAGAKADVGSGMASLERLIPAPVSAGVADVVTDYARRAFVALDCSGVVRIDFLMDDETGQVWFNEINTIPGSFSFYLWEPSGIPFDTLVQSMVDIAVTRFEERTRRVRSYDVNLLGERSASGLKGAKT